MWSVIYQWPWTVIWSGISGVGSILTVFVAIWALFRWSKQDELKAKLAFKQAVCDYADNLSHLPTKLHMQDMDMYSDAIERQKNLLVSCHHKWLITEGSIKNKDVQRNWNEIAQNHFAYFYHDGNQADLRSNCSRIMNTNFVFNKR